MKEIFLSSEVVAAIVGAMLGAILGAFLTPWVAHIFRRRDENSKKSQIRYAKNALKLAKDELKDKLRIVYDGMEISQLHNFTLKLENSGKRTIRNQAFTCLFDNDTESINPAFPRITTIPAREVGPIIRDNTIRERNEFRFVIDTLGVSQVVKIEFLTVGNKSNNFDVIFKPNDLDEVSFVESYDPYVGDELTPQEEEITMMTLEGLATVVIAEYLYMDDAVVNNILKRVYKKKGVKSRNELIDKLKEK